MKAPQVITHEKRLIDAGAELAEFIENVAPLRGKLGAVLFHFPYWPERL